MDRRSTIVAPFDRARGPLLTTLPLSKILVPRGREGPPKFFLLFFFNLTLIFFLNIDFPKHLSVDRQSTPVRPLKISESFIDQFSRNVGLNISKNKIETLLSAVVLTIELRSLQR